jgi:hypothetical protein
LYWERATLGGIGMDSQISKRLEDFFRKIVQSRLSKNMLSRFDSTIQFRIVEKVKDQPSEWYGSGEGEWCYIDFEKGLPHFGHGNVQSKRDWKKTTLVEVEKKTLEAILEGKERAVEALLDDRLTIGGGNWPMFLVLLRLGQVHERYGDYLSSNYVKAIFR